MTDVNLAIERGAEAGAYSGAAAATFLWGFSVSEIAVTVSAVFAGLSFLVHLYFSWRRDVREAQEAQRDAERHQLVVEEMRDADSSLD